MVLMNIKDPHINIGFQNRIRLEYNKTITEKWEEIKKIIAANDVKLVMATGDLFEINILNKWSFKAYKSTKTFMKKHVPLLYSCVGNHDYFEGKSGKILSEETIFDDLVEQGLIKNVSRRVKIIGGVGIYGLNYYHEMDDLLYGLNIVYEKIKRHKDEGKIKSAVLVSHTTILPKDQLIPLIKSSVHLTYEYLAINYPLIDVHCLGHYHRKQELIKINKSTFVSPWNLMRMSRDKHVREGNHIPQVSLLHFSDDGTFEKAQYIDLKHRPFNKAFKEEITEDFGDVDLDKIKLDFDLTDFTSKKLTDGELLDIIIKKEEMGKEVKDLYEQYYR